MKRLSYLFHLDFLKLNTQIYIFIKQKLLSSQKYSKYSEEYK